MRRRTGAGTTARPGGGIVLAILLALVIVGGMASAQQQQTDPQVKPPLVASPRGEPPNGLVGYWKLDEGAGRIAFDYSGRQTHAEIVGDAVWENGEQGPQLRLDGKTAYVAIPDGPWNVGAPVTYLCRYRADPPPPGPARQVRWGTSSTMNWAALSRGHSPSARAVGSPATMGRRRTSAARRSESNSAPGRLSPW